MRKPLEIAGNKYGMLTAIKNIGKTKNGESIWLCHCDCGSTTNVSIGKLRKSKNPTKSCGCLRGKLKDELNKTYGYLKVLSKSKTIKSNHIHWLCHCECGRMVEVSGVNLRSGNTTSCGCKRQSPMETILYNEYKNKAKDRNLDFSITEEHFNKKLKEPCGYCGIKPNNLRTRRYDYDTKFLFYNGIDRMDNNQGYTFDNIIPCCKWCNYAKRERTVEEFLKWNETLFLNQQKQSQN